MSVFLAGIASALALARPDVERLDADLASLIRADYSADPEGTTLAPLDEGIIDVARQDEDNLRKISGVDIVPVFFPDDPGDGDSTPDDGGSTPDDAGSTPDDGGSTPDDGGSTPDDGGSSPGSTPTPTPTPLPAPRPTPTPKPVSTSFVSAADTFATENTPNQNQGSNKHMRVDGEISKLERSFVVFDLSSIPGGTSVSSATLNLCFASLAQKDPQDRSHELRRVTSPWTETGLTWDNQPLVSTAVSDVFTVPSEAECITVDVTADVQAWLGGASNHGWRIAHWLDTGTTQVTYATREHSNADLRPRLSITYAQ